MSKAGRDWTDEEILLAVEKKSEGASWREIGEAVGRSADAARAAFRNNERFRAKAFGDDIYAEVKDVQMVSMVNAGKQGITHRLQANRPHSEEEFCDLFGVDLERWLPHGKMEHTQWGNNFRTKMEFIPNLRGTIASEKWDELLGILKDKSPRHPKVRAKRSGVLYIIEIVDAHLGMRSWGAETGTDWDLDLALEEYRAAFRYLLARMPADCEKLILRIGDDIFHYDKLDQGKVGTTFAGTPQDIDSRYYKMYSEVAHMVIDCILEALEVLPNIGIIIMPGNHDTHSCQTLGELLIHRFWNDERVTIDNEPKQFKFLRWGSNLLGFTHGTGGKRQFKALPDTMKQRARTDWGQTLYAEWHTADKHHEFVSDEDGKMVVMRILPALCPNDKWHDGQQYASYRGAQAFEYTKQPGCKGVHPYWSRYQNFPPNAGSMTLGET